MERLKILFISISLFLFYTKAAASVFKMTKFECYNIDDKFQKTTCSLKAWNKTTHVANLETRLSYKVTHCLIQLELFRKATKTVYKPFLFNYTADACEFMENQAKFQLLKMVYDIFAKYSNLNHPCPFEDEVTLKDLITEVKTAQIPLPTSEYLLKMNWILNRKLRLTVNVWFMYEEQGWRG